MVPHMLNAAQNRAILNHSEFYVFTKRSAAGFFCLANSLLEFISKTDVEGDFSCLSPETLDETNIQLYFGFSPPVLGVSVALVL